MKRPQRDGALSRKKARGSPDGPCICPRKRWGTGPRDVGRRTGRRRRRTTTLLCSTHAQKVGVRVGLGSGRRHSARCCGNACGNGVEARRGGARAMGWGRRISGRPHLSNYYVHTRPTGKNSNMSVLTASRPIGCQRKGCPPKCCRTRRGTAPRSPRPVSSAW